MANESTTQRDANDDGGSLRCHCGSLLARIVPGGVEVKCRRCKRTVVITVDRTKERRP